jgi:MoaA/NifB/PqqE/SkfB family radical SAM enzyme
MYTRYFSIYFLITEQCNLLCSHCIRKTKKTVSADMPIDRAVQKLESLASAFERAVLIISGGEPSLHIGFPIILETSMRCFPRVTLTTNGTFNNRLV